MTEAVHIQPFDSRHQGAFERLNRAWIEKYFWMEPIDVEVLQHPNDHIINHGGHILMALVGEEAVGTVALKNVAAGIYEFTKMAVDENYQGRRIGLQLAQAAIEKGRSLGAQKIILYSNTRLEQAIRLYRGLGFQEVPLDGPYKRSNIKMELALI